MSRLAHRVRGYRLFATVTFEEQEELTMRKSTEDHIQKFIQNQPEHVQKIIGYVDRWCAAKGLGCKHTPKGISWRRANTGSIYYSTHDGLGTNWAPILWEDAPLRLLHDQEVHWRMATARDKAESRGWIATDQGTRTEPFGAKFTEKDAIALCEIAFPVIEYAIAKYKEAGMEAKTKA